MTAGEIIVDEYELLDPKAIQAAHLLMSVNCSASSNRHNAAATTASLYHLLMKEPAETCQSFACDGDSFAWQVRKAADSMQKLISDRLDVHCKSLHDAIHMLRTKCKVESGVSKFLWLTPHAADP